MVYPEYPPALRKAGVTGVVTVQLSISPDGTVSGATVHESTNDELNDYAVKATSQWQFDSYAVTNGSTGPLCVLVPIRFSLSSN
jgi:TonB family protein